MISPIDLLPPLHPPGRSRTLPAWGALGALLFLGAMLFFYSFLLQEAINLLFWTTKPLLGISIHAQTQPVKIGRPLRWRKILLSTGSPLHASHLELDDVSLQLAPLWKIIVSGHPFVEKLEILSAQGVLDFREEPSLSAFPFLKNQVGDLRSFLKQKVALLPSSLLLRDLSLLLLLEKDSCYLDHAAFFLSQKEPGYLSYQSLFLESGGIKIMLPAAHGAAFWDGEAVSIKNLPLEKEIELTHLKLTPLSDRLEFGFAASLWGGWLRGDGSLRKRGEHTLLEGALLAECLSIEKLSRLLKFQKKLFGLLQEGRLTFRGSPGDPINAEASLRMLVSHLRFSKRESTSLSVASSLIGRKLSIDEFQLQQQENYIHASGEISLPQEWHHLARAPFHCKLKAALENVSELGEMIGEPWSGMSGKFFMDGDIQGEANRANGYLHLQGVHLSLGALPENTLESTLLFEGDQTKINNADLWSSTDHLSISGNIANSWPHAYQAEGRLSCHHFLEKAFLAQQGIKKSHQENGTRASSWASTLLEYLSSAWRLNNNTGKNADLLQAFWKGHGGATAHEGTFDLQLHGSTLKDQPLRFQCLGSYTPHLLECSLLNIHWGEKQLSTSLALSAKSLDFSELKLREREEPILWGGLSLPLHPRELFGNTSLSKLLNWEDPMKIDLALAHFPLQEVAPSLGSYGEHVLLHGRIQSSGPWSEPTLHVTLDGRKISSSTSSTLTKSQREEKGEAHPKTLLHCQLSSRKGEGEIDFSLQRGEGQNTSSIKLQGSLPIGLLHQEGKAMEHSLQDQDSLLLLPREGPLQLHLLLSRAPLDPLWNLFVNKESLLLQEATLHGEAEIEGKIRAPEFSGSLQLQAKKCSLTPLLSPLRNLQAAISLSKDKMVLQHGSTLLGLGKIDITGSSIQTLGALHHEYHLQGDHLLLYEKGTTRLQGRASLLLKGDSSGGKLTGNLEITQLQWKPQLRFTPFLLPPGILFPSELSQPPSATSWSAEIAVRDHFSSQDSSSTRASHTSLPPSSLPSIDLHLLGPLCAPAPEGSVLFSNLDLHTPRVSMKFLKGSMNFSLQEPWKPHFQISSSAILGPYRIITHLQETPPEPQLADDLPPLFFQSTPFLTQERAALLLAMPGESTSSSSRALDALRWVLQLPAWIRAEEIFEPTTILQPNSSPKDLLEQRKYLGFAGSDCYYHLSEGN